MESMALVATIKMEPTQASPQVGKSARGEEKVYGNGSLSPGAQNHVKPIYDLDPDTLDCGICMEPLSAPVFQCENGHIACSACCEKLTEGCPSCAKPIGSIRNIAVEKIIASLQVSCKHVGCKEMLRFTMKKEHEKQCEYMPFNCPGLGCKYSGPKCNYRLHFANEHKTRTVALDPTTMQAADKVYFLDLYVLLYAPNRLFLLHREINALGDTFFLTSFGDEEHYNLKVQIQTEKKFYVMDTMTTDIRHEKDWRKDYLLIPRQFDTSAIRTFQVDFHFPSLLPSTDPKSS